MAPAISAASRDFYLAYLNSASWRVTRNRALRLAHYRCRRCDSKHDLQVHHRTYERLGREWDQDLEVLCATCHHEHHIDEAERTLGVYLKLARMALRDRWTGSFADLNADMKALCAQHRVPDDRRLIEQALQLLMREIPVAWQSRTRSLATPAEDDPQPDADPCACDACVAAGVSTRRQRRDPDTLALLHGDALRRWWDAHDAFYARADRIHARPMPEPARTPEEQERVVMAQLKQFQRLAYVAAKGKRYPVSGNDMPALRQLLADIAASADRCDALEAATTKEEGECDT